MAYILIPFVCVYPISFDSLTEIAASCAVVLIIEAIVLFWKKFPSQQVYRLLLIGVALAAGLWSCALAYIASRNVFICAGLPNASADLMRRAQESYNTLTMVQVMVNATLAATIILVLIGIFAFLQRSRSNA